MLIKFRGGQSPDICVITINLNSAPTSTIYVIYFTNTSEQGTRLAIDTINSGQTQLTINVLKNSLFTIQYSKGKIYVPVTENNGAVTNSTDNTLCAIQATQTGSIDNILVVNN